MTIDDKIKNEKLQYNNNREDQGIKQAENLKALKPEENKEGIKSIEGIFPKDMRTNAIKNEMMKLCREW